MVSPLSLAAGLAGHAMPPAIARPRVSLIVAIASNGVIGRDNALPWHLPEDLRRFKALTIDKPILMGRKTFESIGRPLPRRRNLVLTTRANNFPEGVYAVNSLVEAIENCRDDAELVVIGGAAVYAAALPLASRIYRTRVEADVEGDVRFPDIEAATWRTVSSERWPKDERHAFAMQFEVLEPQLPPQAP